MSPEAHLDPAGIVSRQFGTARRGLDSGEVRAYLRQLSQTIEALQGREAELLERAEQAEARAVDAERLDEHRLVELLGEETARVLAASREAAADIKRKAQESASRLISEANDQAHQVRAEAERAIGAQRAEMLAEIEALRDQATIELDRRRAEADEVVARMLEEAERECESLRLRGEQARKEAGDDAKKIRAEAQKEGRQMVAEAQLVRERMLRDLARRRRAAREQLERLHAGRDRLLAAYEVVRRTVAEATAELQVAMPEAKIAGDQAMRRVLAEPEPTVGEMEAQVSMARIAGLLEPLQPFTDLEGPGEDESDEPAPGPDEVTLEPIVTPEVDLGPGDPLAAPLVLTGDEELQVEPATEPEPGAGPDLGRRADAEPGDDRQPHAESEPASDVESEPEATEVGAVAGQGAPQGLEDVEDGGGEGTGGIVAALDDENATVGVAAALDRGDDENATVGVAAALDRGDDQPGASPSHDLDELFARLRREQDRGTADDLPAPVLVGEQTGVGIDRGGIVDGQGRESRESSRSVAGNPGTAAGAATGPDSLRRTGEPTVPDAAHDDAEAETAAAEHGPDAVLLHQRDVALDAIERDLSRLLKRALADEQNEVLDRLRRSKPTSADELLPSQVEQADRYADAARDELDAAANWGAIHISDANDPRLEGFCDALAAELGQAVVQPLRERIARSFVETGGDMGEVTGRLRALYREWKGQRIAEAVRHFTVAAYAQGAYAALPTRAPLRWLVDRSGDPCPDADDNALAGLVRKGEAFPTGDRCPPAHLGCRCLVVRA